MTAGEQGPRRWLLASSNAGKLREFSALLAEGGIAVIGQNELGINAAPEPYGTFIENALAKARHASRASGLPALADDSGICVDALAGAPGVHSARFAALAGAGEGDEANNRHLLRQLAGVRCRDASYYCVLVMVRSAADPQPLIADGVWRGVVIDQARGLGGFGYDPHFLIPELGRTAAELTAEEKNRLSHRGQAMRRLREQAMALGLLDNG